MAKLSQNNVKLLADHLAELARNAVQNGYDGYALYVNEAAQYIDAAEQDVVDSADDICRIVGSGFEFSCALQMDSDNVGCFMTDIKQTNISVKVVGDDVYINNTLHTFDNSKLSVEQRVLWALAGELGFEPAYLFGEYWA